MCICNMFVGPWEDELGVEGVVILPNSKVKNVRLGSHVAQSRVKRVEHVDSADAGATHEKNKAAQVVHTNTKDCNFVQKDFRLRLQVSEVSIQEFHFIQFHSPTGPLNFLRLRLRLPTTTTIWNLGKFKHQSPASLNQHQFCAQGGRGQSFGQCGGGRGRGS